MTKTLSAPLILLALAAIAAPAAAQETEASAAAKFKREFAATDTNHDGYWSRAEVAARVARMRVGRSKADAAQTKRLADLWFATADTNKDGRVSEAEAERLLRTMFERYDANHDGRIGGPEAARAKAAIGKR